MHESLDKFKFQPDTDTNTRVICPCASEKLLYNVVSSLAPSILIGYSSCLQVTRTSVLSRTSSKFGQIGPRTVELAALEHLEKIPIDLQWEKSCEHSSALLLNWIFFILAGNKDIHESLDEFEFQPDTTSYSRVICPCVPEKLL